MKTIIMQHEFYKGNHFTVFSAPMPKVRKTWGTLNPTTRIKPSKRLYKRNKRVTID